MSKPITPAQIKWLVRVFKQNGNPMRVVEDATIKALIRRDLLAFEENRRPRQGNVYVTAAGVKLIEPLWAAQVLHERRLERVQKRASVAHDHHMRAKRRFEQVAAKAVEYPERASITRIARHLELLRRRSQEVRVAEQAYAEAQVKTRGPTHAEIMAFLIGRKLNPEVSDG